MPLTTRARPDDFLQLVVHDLSADPTLTGLCAGYEGGRWRARELASHVMEWLPDFALSWSEASTLSSGTAVAQMRSAARRVYLTDKYHRRGEFGEMLLHIALRQVFGTVPAISKLFFKDSANHVVHGFDCVHVVHSDDTLELWLGEAKFYEALGPAIEAAAASVRDHVATVTLRSEFAALLGKVDPASPFHDPLTRLLHPHTSLDSVFSALCVPVFLTYESDAVAGHRATTPEYRDAVTAEFRTALTSLASKLQGLTLRVHLIVLPLESKGELVRELHEALKRWQSI